WPDYPNGRPIICLSRGRPGDKDRFSLAHEFGHLVLHQLRDA
ncbi:MAG: ImmA/IrrE family metallo-endopeptidase, partial [Cyanobacteria bacterium REEB65]|nr:ImmA/IrrE family metallo-endopeptidase [Cyanobacteria bacterium REEB65]